MTNTTDRSIFNLVQLAVRDYWHVLAAVVGGFYVLVNLMIDVSVLRETVRQHDNEIQLIKTNYINLREDILVLKEQAKSTDATLTEVKSLLQKIDDRVR